MRFLAFAAVLLVVGCGKPAKPVQTVAMDQVPEVVMKAATAAAKEKFPDLKFQSVSMKPNGVYELSGKTKNGKVHDVEVTPAGEVVEVE
jgi:hypothetical protein